MIDVANFLVAFAVGVLVGEAAGGFVAYRLGYWRGVNQTLLSKAVQQ